MNNNEQFKGPIKEFSHQEDDNTSVLDYDAGNWPDSLRVRIVKRGSECLQNKDGPFEAVRRLEENYKRQTR